MNKAERDELIKDNMGLVYMFTHRYMRNNWKKYDFDEFVSQGTIGLIRAAKNFDESRGVKFNTFVGTHINFTMNKMVKNDARYFYRTSENGKDEYLPADISTLNFTGDEFKEEAMYLLKDEFEWSDIDKKLDISGDVKMLLSVLDEKERGIIIDYYLHELPQREIAIKYNMSQSSVVRNTKKALSKMKMNNSDYNYNSIKV